MSTPNKLNALQVKEIRRRRMQGETAKSLAEAFGVTPATIRYQTKGIKPRLIKYMRNWAQIDEARVLMLYGLGYSQSEIARQMNAHPSTINKTLARLEWKAAA